MSFETVETATEAGTRTEAGAAPRAAGGALRGRRTRLTAALHRAAPALALYACLRLAGIGCTALWAWHTGRHPRDLLGASWDSNWYLGIAEWGYAAPVPAGMWPEEPFANLAFFPLYPWLIRAVHTVLPLSAPDAALLIAWAAAAAAAWGIFAVGAHLYGRRAGTLLVVLWAVLPHAVIQSLAYTETLLTALAAWSLYALLTRRWLTAGALAAVAGLARPSALAVIAAVGAAVAAEAWRRRGGTGGAFSRADTVRLWAGALIAPLGWLGYVLWVGARTGGGPGGYFAVQELWGSRFDAGRDALRSVKRLVLHEAPLAHHMVVAVVAMALLLFVLLALDRPPLPLLAYTAVLLLLALGGSGYFPSKGRFLLPAFPLLLPAALALSRARLPAVLLTTAALATLSTAYGVYLLAVYDMPL